MAKERGWLGLVPSGPGEKKKREIGGGWGGNNQSSTSEVHCSLTCTSNGRHTVSNKRWEEPMVGGSTCYLDYDT